MSSQKDWTLVCPAWRDLGRPRSLHCYCCLESRVSRVVGGKARDSIMMSNEHGLKGLFQPQNSFKSFHFLRCSINKNFKGQCYSFSFQFFALRVLMECHGSYLVLLTLFTPGHGQEGAGIHCLNTSMFLTRLRDAINHFTRFYFLNISFRYWGEGWAIEFKTDLLQSLWRINCKG